MFMRVVVTGVTSFLGLNTAKKLLECGYEVTGIFRQDNPHMREINDTINSTEAST